MEFSISEFLGFSDDEILIELEKEGIEVSAFKKQEVGREAQMVLEA